jgi:hypothetical protein
MVCNFYFSDDKLNKRNERNRDNTPNSEYNCAGWALDCFSWYRPTNNPTFHKWGATDYPHDYNEEQDGRLMSATEMFNVTLQSVDAMLRDFEDLRVIRDLHELKKDEHAIAFRIGHLVNDFHYCKRSKNGHWTHKMGGGRVQPIAKKDVFAENWFEEYCGHLVLFAKKDIKSPQKDLTKEQECDIIVIQGREVKL